MQTKKKCWISVVLQRVPLSHNAVHNGSINKVSMLDKYKLMKFRDSERFGDATSDDDVPPSSAAFSVLVGWLTGWLVGWLVDWMVG